MKLISLYDKINDLAEFEQNRISNRIVTIFGFATGVLGDCSGKTSPNSLFMREDLPTCGGLAYQNKLAKTKFNDFTIGYYFADNFLLIKSFSNARVIVSIIHDTCEEKENNSLFCSGNQACKLMCIVY